MCKDLKLIALAIDENFSEFLTFLASTLGVGEFLHFPSLNFIT